MDIALRIYIYGGEFFVKKHRFCVQKSFFFVYNTHHLICGYTNVTLCYYCYTTATVCVILFRSSSNFSAPNLNQKGRIFFSLQRIERKSFQLYAACYSYIIIYLCTVVLMND